MKRAIFFCGLLSLLCFAGHDAGNGGDGDAFDFPIIGNLIHAEFTKLKSLDEEKLKAFMTAIENTRIEVVTKEVRDRYHTVVDAVTDPDPQRPGKPWTQVNQDRFRKRMEEGTVFRLVCHEYFRAAKIPDDQVFTLKSLYPVLDKLNARYLENIKKLRELAAATRREQIPQLPGLDPKELGKDFGKDLPAQLASPDERTRREAFDDVLEIADLTGVKLMEVHAELDKLRHPDADKRRAAVYAIQTLRTKNSLAKMSIPYLIQVLADQDMATGLAASATLGKMGTEAIDPLILALKHPNAKINELAADSLGDLGKDADKACPSLRALYLKHYGTNDWPRVAASVEHNLKKIRTPEALRVLGTLEQDKEGAVAAKLDKIREDVYAEEAKKRGVTVDEIRARVRRFQERQSGVVGLSLRAAVEMRPDLFVWDAPMGLIVWTDPSGRADPVAHFKQQTYTYHLLSQWGGQLAPIQFPSLSEDSRDGIREFYRRESREKLETDTHSLYVWDEKVKAIRWTDPIRFRDPIMHYQRQVYARYVLAGIGVGNRVPPVQPPGTHHYGR